MAEVRLRRVCASCVCFSSPVQISVRASFLFFLVGAWLRSVKGALIPEDRDMVDVAIVADGKCSPGDTEVEFPQMQGDAMLFHPGPGLHLEFSRR